MVYLRRVKIYISKGLFFFHQCDCESIDFFLMINDYFLYFHFIVEIMTLHNNFSLQQLLSEAPPSTSDLQLVKETEILPDHKNPKPKVQEEGLKSTENAINKMKSESLNLTTPLENQQQQQQPKLHKGIPMVRDSEARSSITADVKASQSPYPSKNQQRKIKKHRQAKKDKARKATEQHNDNPREILDLDFDTLLSYHEKAKVTKNETKGIPTKGKRVGSYTLQSLKTEGS